MSLTVDEALQSLAFIRDVPGSVIQELARIGSIQTFEAGERIFVEGELREQFAVVLEGNVMLEMNVPGRGELKILSLGPGDVLGWSALVNGGRMTTSAQAIDGVQLLTFPGDQIRQLTHQNHELGYFVFQRLATALSRRLLSTRLQLLDLYGASSPPVDPSMHTTSEMPPVY